jgi:sigma-B regulation protein RsbU (phosphoserine phosphatase)
VKLIGTDGTHFFSWDLAPGKHTLGRKPECDFVVPDKTVSRQHAEIEVATGGGGFFLTDLGSHNGTMVNGVKISARTPIKPGDRILFGEAEFRLSDSGEFVSATRNAPASAKLSEIAPEKSIFLSINEALKPLPPKVTDLPNLFPTLSEMARMLVLHEPREVMLQRSLEMLSRVIPAERLAILFRSANQEDIYPAATLLPGGKDPGSFSLSRTIVRDILTDKNAVLLGNPADDPRYAQQKSIIMSDLKSAMAVPLFDQGEVLGILYADTTNPLHRYSDDYLRLLATFGNIIASRIVNYTLLQERQEKQLMEAELRKASQIQKSMLVESVPTLPGYRVHAFQEQSRSVGGDLYDVSCLPDGRLLFMVADVSGKGMGAALLMSNILAAFRISYSIPRFDLREIVTSVSLQMFKYTSPEMFATLFIGLVDGAGHRITYINAGHNPPILLRRDGRMEHIASSGIMIGAFDFGEWKEGTVDMGAGDVLLVFSDGVTEAENRTGQQFSDERLERFMTGMTGRQPAEVAGLLLDEITEFADDAPHSDDITMLLVKREE